MERVTVAWVEESVSAIEVVVDTAPVANGVRCGVDESAVAMAVAWYDDAYQPLVATNKT